MISKCHHLVKDAVLIFWGIPEAISAYSKCCWEFRQKVDNNCGLYWHLLHFQSLKIWPPNVELSFFLSGTLFLPKSLLFCLCVRSTDFVANWASTILYAAVQYAFQFDPYWCQNNLLGLLSATLGKNSIQGAFLAYPDGNYVKIHNQEPHKHQR